MLDSPSSTTRRLYSPVRANPERTAFTELKSLYTFPAIFGTRRRLIVAIYIFASLFIFSTIIFVFHNPFVTHSSLWYKNIFRNKSQFPIIFSRFFPPNTTSNATTFTNSAQFSRKRDGFSREDRSSHGSPSNIHESNSKNSTENKSSKETQFSKKRNGLSGKGRPPNDTGFIKAKSSQEAQVSAKTSISPRETEASNGSLSSGNHKTSYNADVIEPETDHSNEKVKFSRHSGAEGSVVDEKVMHSPLEKEEENKNWFEMMKNCDLFNGRWVKDEQLPFYEPGFCPFIDESFNCFLNGRRDNTYEKHRWKPEDCNIPRWNGRKMLELLRGKRLVYVGDSLNRNMWESMVCLLHNSVQNKSTVYEASDKKEFRTEGSYSFLFTDYNCSVEFFRSPFLVQEWEMPQTNGSKKETLRLDLVQRSSDLYRTADVLVFNTGHWWTHEKTSSGKGYYQEGSHVYDQLDGMEALRKGMTTWSRWIDANVDPKKTLVFFRGYSSSHFSGGQWNSGGQCDSETEPITNESELPHESHRIIMEKVEMVLKGMKTRVFYLNVTRMSEFRKDAHPSIYIKPNLTKEERKLQLKYQDCSHWCLPGVPDTWNEIVYAQLLKKHDQKQREPQIIAQKLEDRPVGKSNTNSTSHDNN